MLYKVKSYSSRKVLSEVYNILLLSSLVMSHRVAHLIPVIRYVQKFLLYVIPVLSYV